MTRRAPAIACAALLAALAALLVLLTPWHPLPGAVPGGHVAASAARDFTPAQIARANAYHDQIRPWGLLALSLSIVVPAAFGFSPLGAALVGRRRRRRWPVQVLTGVLLVTLTTTLVLLPVGAREHVIGRRFDLTEQGWAGWFADAGRGYLVTFVATAVAMVVLVGLARWSPRRWWAWGAAIGAALVVFASYVYPYTVEPFFTTTTSLPAGSLRTSLLDLAKRDGQPLHDILVARASVRTTSENAYVSGFGSSRRLVLYDTLLRDDSPREIRSVTAHELGHVKHHDVFRGTVEGAVAVAAALCLAGLLLGEGRGLPRRMHASGAADPRVVPLVLAAYTVIAFAGSPVVNLVSRHVEADADAHALALDRDPQAFVTAQRKLAVSGLDDLQPSTVLYVLFFDHPSAPQRIAMARDWARQHHVPQPTGIARTPPGAAHRPTLTP